ncbi:MAG: glycoside hydrolase family 97 catalytic domain-containing protein [Gammaproteobacteria bacterium]|nr:glycoside hydrolase family 97 catalytic domain-containing protein [Gammaproteobacteria bacterium]
MRIIFIHILTIILICSCSNSETYSITSPDKKISVTLSLDRKKAVYYTISYNDDVVLQESRLGIKMDDAEFLDDLDLVSASTTNSVSDRYTMMTGKRRDITYQANEKTFSFVNNDQREMDIVFRVSDDGVAFRYHFPGQSSENKRVIQELTTFKFKSDAKAWLQPMQVAQTGWKNTNPAYEEHYRMAIPVGTAAPSEAGWVFPALFESNGTWLLISETNMDGRYCASRLQQQSPNGEYMLGFPMAAEVFTNGALFPESTLPFNSPWRIIAVGSLATIAESTLGTDLANPAIKIDLSFIKPGQASWSWAILKDDSIVYDVQKQFIDYAADMQWEYTLIDVNWDTTIGYDNIKELADYAKTKKVGLLLWYNSSGAWNETDYHPKSMLLTHASRVKEFSRLQTMGIKGVKIDFFAGDGKSMMQYYNDILKDAADYQLLVNFHGATIPRGWQRTYPNLMTMEAVRGFEFLTFFQESTDLEASHSAMLPFTRNAFDPMDFTPTVFGKIPDRIRKTTNGFEIALPVLFLSGIQHIAETPDGIKTVPEYVKEFLRGLPEQWDDTHFIDGYPGKLAVIARRSGNKWYVAGINGEAISKKLLLDLSFIDSNNGYMITDGAEEFSFLKRNITRSDNLALELKPNGGFVMVFN